MHRFQQNRLLALLVDGDLRQLVPGMRELDLEAGAVLFDADQPIDHVYFPLTGVVSLLVVAQDGRDVEAATIGNEGVAGLGGLLAGDVSFSRQTVQLGGQAVRISRAPFLTAVHQSRRMRRVLAAHADAFASQLMQLAACNARHGAEERLARWLLTMADRSGQDSLPFTHQAVAEMLGVQRPTITIAARILQAAGLIHWTRGSLTILDRSGLTSTACECYKIVRDAYDTALKTDAGPD
jgi:CRP-like cAMP-binding protein